MRLVDGGRSGDDGGQMAMELVEGGEGCNYED